MYFKAAAACRIRLIQRRDNWVIPIWNIQLFDQSERDGWYSYDGFWSAFSSTLAWDQNFVCVCFCFFLSLCFMVHSIKFMSFRFTLENNGTFWQWSGIFFSAAKHKKLNALILDQSHHLYHLIQSDWNKWFDSCCLLNPIEPLN